VGDRERDEERAINKNSSASCIPHQDVPTVADDDVYIQGVQKVSVHLMITIQKVTSNVQTVPRQSPDIIDTRLTLTPSVSPNSNYLSVVSVGNCLKYVCMLFIL
jgi:hypothetical protein